MIKTKQLIKEYRKAREKYKPEDGIKVLFIAESPPHPKPEEEPMTWGQDMG